MTHKDFKALAVRLHSNRPKKSDCDDITTTEYSLWQAMVSDVADVCSMSNPRFDRDKFLEACGYDA
jgi:hypothetical protein